MVIVIAPTSDKTAPGRHPVRNGRLAGRRGWNTADRVKSKKSSSCDSFPVLVAKLSGLVELIRGS